MAHLTLNPDHIQTSPTLIELEMVDNIVRVIARNSEFKQVLMHITPVGEVTRITMNGKGRGLTGHQT